VGSREIQAPWIKESESSRRWGKSRQSELKIQSSFNFMYIWRV